MGPLPPRGDGAAVIAVPGFMGSDGYLLELRHWLRRIGYSAYSSEVGQNADCLDLLSRRLLATIDSAADQTGRKVHLVGHSLGGVLARGVCGLRPEAVATVTTMGSPIRGVRSHPLVMRMSEAVRQRVLDRYADQDIDADCFSGDCSCDFVQSTRRRFPEQIPQMAIYTKTDGVVAWRYSRHSDPGKDVEVQGTHSGLAFNALAYTAIARFLGRHSELKWEAS